MAALYWPASIARTACVYAGSSPGRGDGVRSPSAPAEPGPSPSAAANARPARVKRIACPPSGLPVRLHELVRPRGLANLAARQKLCHHGLDVEHRRAVHGVEPADAERSSLAPGDGDHGHAEAVRSVLGALGEDTHARPDRVAARM